MSVQEEKKKNTRRTCANMVLQVNSCCGIMSNVSSLLYTFYIVAKTLT